MSCEIEVLTANDNFYRAMRDADFATMDALWARQRSVTCTHPSWSPLTGRPDVMESWNVILQSEPPQVWPGEPQAVVTGKTAIVICIERIGSLELMAINSFVVENGRWCIVNHQSAHMPAEQAR